MLLTFITRIAFCEDVRFRFWTLFDTQLMNFIRTYFLLFILDLGFLWSFGIPVLLKGDLFRKLVSSYVCIFCAILNNLARVIYVISNCDMAITCITGSNKVNKQDDYTGIFEFS